VETSDCGTLEPRNRIAVGISKSKFD